MTIESDVAAIAKHYGVDPALVQAIVQAEGNILKAVQCSLPGTRTREEAIGITCRSIAHRMSEFVKARHLAGEFVAYLGSYWAPVGVANDPHGLNKNWVRNVEQLWQPGIASHDR